MAEQLTYEDYKRRISIRDILEDAGYRWNRKDGMRYPSYSRADSDGQSVKGDKFIITANGLCCFRPPEMRNYNIISFIKSFPEKFKDYTPGMNLDMLVNKVCCRLLNEPFVQRRKNDLQPAPASVEHKKFDMRGYNVESWDENSWDSQKPFFPFFKNRGISRDTQKAFADYFMLVSNTNSSQRSFRNLAFPMRSPATSRIVGLELRGLPNKEGSSFKGMAQNSDATHGVWLASPNTDITGSGKLRAAKQVYWFESAYDAMAFYQLYPKKAKLDGAVFVSTGGSPSMQQFKGVLAETEKATHHLCFDRDHAGYMFTLNFAIARAKKNYTSYIATAIDEEKGIAKAGQLVVTDQSGNGARYVLDLEPFEYGRLCSILDIGKPDMQDYVASLKDKSNLRSGNYDLLPEGSLSAQLHSEMWAKEEAFNAGEPYHGIPPEERDEVYARCKEEMKDLSKRFGEALQREIGTFRRAGSSTVYQPCEEGFKDWNDQLRCRINMSEELGNDKKQMASEDIVESCLDGTDGVYMERYEAHEEDEEDDEDEEEKEERKSHHKR